MSDAVMSLVPNQSEQDSAEAESLDEVPDLSFEERSRVPRHMDLIDIAGYLKLKSKRAARELIRKLAVPHIKLGGRIFVKSETLFSHIDAALAQPAEPKEVPSAGSRVRRRANRAAAANN